MKGQEKQAFLLVILLHPEPPGPRERTQGDFLGLLSLSFARHAHRYSLGRVIQVCLKQVRDTRNPLVQKLISP